MIRPIIQGDKVFARYQTGNKGQAELAASEQASTKSSSSNGHAWMMLFAVVLIGVFIYWYKYKRSDSKLFGGAEAQSLLRESGVSYNDYQPVH